MEPTCHFCKRPKKTLRRHKATGVLACPPCYQVHLKPRYECSECHLSRPIEAWIDEPSGRRPVCRSCYRLNHKWEDCYYCRKPKRIDLRTDDGQPVCRRCWQLFHNLRQCVDCGLEKPVKARTENGDALCKGCQDKRCRGICPGCQAERILKHMIDGQLHCIRCWRHHNIKPCVECGHTRPIEAKGMCSGCYGRTLRRRATRTHSGFPLGTGVYHRQTHQRGVVEGHVTIAGLPPRKARAVLVRLPSGQRETWPLRQSRLIVRPVRTVRTA